MRHNFFFEKYAVAVSVIITWEWDDVGTNKDIVNEYIYIHRHSDEFLLASTDYLRAAFP